MSDSIVPECTDENVARLVRKLGLTGRPIRVPVRPEPKAVPSNCFPNVDGKVAAAGGQRVHGWTLWLFPQVWIQGEFHAIWGSPDGELIDVTPKADGEATILFMPDPVRTYTGRAHHNVHHLISDKPLVRMYVDLLGFRNTFLETRRLDDARTVELVGSEVDLWDAVAEALRILWAVVRHGNASRNHACPCGSGTKFKGCHEGNILAILQQLGLATK